jgi:hypothetical protein
VNGKVAFLLAEEVVVAFSVESAHVLILQ